MILDLEFTLHKPGKLQLYELPTYPVVPNVHFLYFNFTVYMTLYSTTQLYKENRLQQGCLIYCIKPFRTLYLLAMFKLISMYLSQT